MAGTKWERFIARLDEHGIITPNGNTPEELADGINQCLSLVEKYEEETPMLLLYLILATERSKEWQEACDRLADVNERCQKELHKIPHKIIEKMKNNGLTPPKGVAKACPKRFETVSKEEVDSALAARVRAHQHHKAVAALCPIPVNQHHRKGDGSAYGQALELYDQGVRPF